MNRYRVCRVINAGAVIGNCEIEVQDDRIQSVGASTPSARGERTYAFAVPGFIDMHTHGGAGFDIMDATPEAFTSIAQHHLVHGTTTFLGSTLTAPLEEIGGVLCAGRQFLEQNRREAARGTSSSMLGFHIEGPWISTKNKGAHDEKLIIPPDEKAIALIREYADILAMVTFSYHYPTADDLLACLNETGIIAACGHDETIDERILQGFSKGISHVTHLYSTTASFQRVGGFKHLGTAEMSLMTPGIFVEVIPDGRHITRRPRIRRHRRHQHERGLRTRVQKAEGDSPLSRAARRGAVSSEL